MTSPHKIGGIHPAANACFSSCPKPQVVLAVVLPANSKRKTEQGTLRVHVARLRCTVLTDTEKSKTRTGVKRLKQKNLTSTNKNNSQRSQNRRRKRRRKTRVVPEHWKGSGTLWFCLFFKGCAFWFLSFLFCFFLRCCVCLRFLWFARGATGCVASAVVFCFAR